MIFKLITLKDRLEKNMVSIKDVAQLAGVSPSTVSLVLNGSNLVKHETAYKVRQAIEQLHYVPNQAARSLVTKEKKVIAMILIVNDIVTDGDLNVFDRFADTLMVDMLAGVQTILAPQGYSILTKIEQINTPLEKIDVFDKSKIDGAIFIGGMLSQELLERVKETNIPVVYAYSTYENKNVDFVGTDPEKGIYLAAKHVLECGHRKIAFINGSLLSMTNEKKLLGYKSALEEFGVPFQEDWVKDSEYIGRAGYRAMQQLWEEGKRPTAMVGGSDVIALGAYRFLYEQGLRCPQDISVVGYEFGILSASSVPPMTSVCVWKREVGIEAARVLINRIKNPKAKPVKMIIPPQLIYGESVAKVEM